MSAEARDYSARALDAMQAHSIRRFEIEWRELRERVVERAGAARRPAETHGAIRYALRELGDGHSLLYVPGVTSWAKRQAGKARRPQGELLQDRWGYLLVPGFINPDHKTRENVRFARDVQRLIAEIYGQGPRGWIVDLRDNFGGNLWPMLAGLGPLLGEGEVGAFVDPTGQRTRWVYGAGTVRKEKRVMVACDRPWALPDVALPLAVLTGEETASAGEAMAVAFRGRPETHSFGGSTTGRSTVNRRIELDDGSLLFLTVGNYSDRTGAIYGGKIDPDTPVENGERPAAPAIDPVALAAVAWLERRRDASGG